MLLDNKNYKIIYNKYIKMVNIINVVCNIINYACYYKKIDNQYKTLLLSLKNHTNNNRIRLTIFVCV